MMSGLLFGTWSECPFRRAKLKVANPAQAAEPAPCRSVSQNRRTPHFHGPYSGLSVMPQKSGRGQVQNFLVNAPASEISHHRPVVRGGRRQEQQYSSFRWSLRHRSLHSNKSSFRFRYGWALHTPGHENHPDTAAAAAHRKETDDTGLQSSRLRLPTHHPPA